MNVSTERSVENPRPAKRRKLNASGSKPPRLSTRKQIEKRMNDMKKSRQASSRRNADFLVTGGACGFGGGNSGSSGWDGITHRDCITNGMQSSGGGRRPSRTKCAAATTSSATAVEDEFFAGLMSPAQQMLRRHAYEAFTTVRKNTTDSAELPVAENDCTDMVVVDAHGATVEVPLQPSKTIFLTDKHYCDAKCYYKPVNRGACADYHEKNGVQVDDLRAGHVYACTQSGHLHVCTQDLCDAQAPANGYPTCWKTGIVFNAPILTPSKEYFSDNPMPTRVQIDWMDKMARNQCESAESHSAMSKGRASTGAKRKRATEDPSAKKLGQARKIVQVLVFTIPNGLASAQARIKPDDSIINRYADIIMRMWNFSLKSPHSVDRERATEQQRKNGKQQPQQGAVKFKRDSLTMKFPQFVFASLYMMRFGYEIQPDFTSSMLKRANGLSEHLTAEFADDHRVCFLLRDEYLDRQLLAINRLPPSKSTVSGVYIDRKYINAGQQLMRLCFSSWIVKAVEDLVDSTQETTAAISGFEGQLAELHVPMNTTEVQ